MKCLIMCILSFVTFGAIAENSGESILANFQQELLDKQLILLDHLQKQHINESQSLENGLFNFTPEIVVGTFSCGLMPLPQQEAKVMFTLEFVKEIRTWIPINGQAIKTNYWNVTF
jgi:hypothetical protein